jgi:hypothetical protein
MKLMKRQEKGLPAFKKEKEKKDDKKKVKKRKVLLFKKKEVEIDKPKKEKKKKINIIQQAINVFKFFAFNKNNVKSLIVNFEVINAKLSLEETTTTSQCSLAVCSTTIVIGSFIK